MLHTTLVFLFNLQGHILLSLKKRGFGIGKWNGAGGKLHKGETILQGALRELEEEVWVKLKEENLEYRGLLKFLFVSEPEKSWDCSIFFADYDGEVRESDEMAPQWFALDDIPYNTMREDDKIWLPELLNWAKEIIYEFSFASMESDKLLKRKKIL